MENSEVTLNNKNESLSLSYLDGIKRINQQINEIGILTLPKKILTQRKEDWNKLFEKYSENISNDDEISINDSNLESRNNKQNNNKNKDNADDGEYFLKCPTPMRKHPALIQYWVDTGNPPYQLADETSSGTGSSLSEGENSKFPLLIVNEEENIDSKQDNNTSLCSSVDTAAYILSNTNVTNKSETIAIVEGAKNPDMSSRPIANSSMENILLKNSSINCIIENATIKKCDNSYKLNDKLDISNAIESNIELLTKKSTANEINDPLLNEKIVTSEKEKNVKNFNNSAVNIITDNSMKITDVLPTLAHLDKVLNSNNIENEEQEKVLSDENCLFEGTPKRFNQQKSFNRKKLYTKRDSPIDIIMTTLNKRKSFSIKNTLHPALLTPVKSNTLFSRRRTSAFQRRRKMQFSQLSAALQNSDNKINGHKDNEITRAKDNGEVLKSIELTDSNEKSCQHSEEQLTAVETSPIQNNGEKINKSNNTYHDNKVLNNNKIESSENNNEKLENKKKLEDLMALCSKKNLEIKLERYVETKLIPENILKNTATNKQLPTKLTPIIRTVITNDIHEIDLESQESDQSTILICKCINNTNSKITFNTKNPIKFQGKINENIESLNKSKLNLNQSKENIRVIINEQNEINKTNRASNIICSALLLESDDNSSTHSSPRLQSKSQTYFTKPVINFSSDEEVDFVRIIRENSKRAKKKHIISMSNIGKSHSRISNNCDNLIKDLTGQCMNESTILPAFVTTTNLTIAQSDDEEIINSQKSTARIQKKSTKLQMKTFCKPKIRTTPPTLLLSNITNTKQKSMKSTVAKVLQFQSSSDTSTSNEDILTPPRKSKFNHNIKSKAMLNTSVDKSKIELKEPSDKQSIIKESIVQLNGNMAQWNRRKRKMKVHFANESTEIPNKSKANKKPSKLISPVKQLNNVCKNIEGPLKKLSPPVQFTPLCPLSINDKKIVKKRKYSPCNDDIGIIGNKNIKVREQNSEKLKSPVMENGYLQFNNPIENSKTNSIILKDFDSDDETIIIKNKSDIKLSLTNEKNENNAQKKISQTIITSLLDDSSNDESLTFDSCGQNEYVNSNGESKRNTIIFQTRFDDSDFDT